MDHVVKIKKGLDIQLEGIPSPKISNTPDSQFIGNFFMQHSNPTLELFITMGIAILVIIISLITNAMICTSPFLAHYLLGVKK